MVLQCAGRIGLSETHLNKALPFQSVLYVVMEKSTSHLHTSVVATIFQFLLCLPVALTYLQGEQPE